MEMVIPVIVRFPVGLVIYWVTTNLWTVGQGLVTRQLVPKAKPPPKRSSRTPPKAEAKSEDGAAAQSDEKPAAPPAHIVITAADAARAPMLISIDSTIPTPAATKISNSGNN